MCVRSQDVPKASARVQEVLGVCNGRETAKNSNHCTVTHRLIAVYTKVRAPPPTEPVAARDAARDATRVAARPPRRRQRRRPRRQRRRQRRRRIICNRRPWRAPQGRRETKRGKRNGGRGHAGATGYRLQH